MRILHVNPFYHPYAGGIERRIHETGRRLSKRHDVHVLTARLPGTPAEESHDGIHVHRLPSRFWFGRWYNPPLVTTRGVAAAIGRLDPDVVDFHFRWSPSWSRAFDAWEGPKVFTYHNTYGEGSGPLGLLSRLNDRSTRRFIARSDRIVAVSRFLADDLERHGFPPERLDVVPNGVDAAALSRLAGPRTKRQTPTLVCVGRAVRLKGFDTVIDALPRLDPGLRLVVCGEGPYRRSLARRARRLGVADRVDLPGWVDETRKLRLIRDAVAYVHAARFEAFGLSVLEALALGAPVVATRVGGIPQVVGRAGILVPPDDPEALADAIRKVRTDARLRQRLARAGPLQARGFTWDAVSRRLLDVYHRAARNG